MWKEQVTNDIKNFMKDSYDEKEILNKFTTDPFLTLEKKLNKFSQIQFDVLEDYMAALKLFEKQEYLSCLKVLKPMVEACISSAIFLTFKIYEDCLKELSEIEEARRILDFTFVIHTYNYLYYLNKVTNFHLKINPLTIITELGKTEQEKRYYLYLAILEYYIRKDNGDKKLLNIGYEFEEKNRWLVFIYFSALKENKYAQYALALEYERIGCLNQALFWLNKVYNTSEFEYGKLKESIERKKEIIEFRREFGYA